MSAAPRAEISITSGVASRGLPDRQPGPRRCGNRQARYAGRPRDDRPGSPGRGPSRQLERAQASDLGRPARGQRRGRSRPRRANQFATVFDNPVTKKITPIGVVGSRYTPSRTRP